MCDEELILFEFLEADSEENSMRRRRLDARAQFDPFDLEDNEFIKRYRLSKELVVGLCDEIRPAMKAPRRSTDISVETKVLTALSFYATGSYQRPVGDISAHSMAQQTVSSVIAQVTACIDSVEMRKKYITFPKSNDERNEIRVRFYHKFGIPGVVGCIDCTQIAIVRPNRNEERYFCRKHYHSLNVQLICDADMQIISVDASFGGATHDSFIWNDHPIKQHLENLQESTWLLGDSGYPLRKYLMTPIVNAIPNTPESHYTDMHVRARNVIERTIGLLKARFRCLLVHRVLHYKPRVAASIVNACVILHNICNRANLPAPQLSSREIMEESQMQLGVAFEDQPNTSSNNQALQQGVATRNQLILRLWEARRS
ncbi:putative nuclease HARBI1 isoform X1 [Aricia agestis]|uniref:putative nuclease HARBI1 isoform X1 n=1 Tax=Aricia agestis TaxID=91739 RepID=UPI001C204F2E|nr:putative nuclease HARBI1 isoform X1 [Aricia agestis]XP_041977651.1 putative nuclease HARBI1 isoform X1 [Aricia agestis]XP_041977652.1 putative nuclease HARBI1 isoform X1 [Aricia agestis]XP_041977653.1 putative nuclease HARBI1 isoform X1 [Aricia agestis]XP_041982261.1 putative nuclease HARBI1 isoform X1 [Aricia agestis]XP_041982262.1 putative nuclease HARBI1 isoform X1 [Aricia agestis]XP_041982264.1 putative nuclease HARBI1 isoform X1 [Aricia agestis]XP_041982265.1 putative nuclease HARBI1